MQYPYHYLKFVWRQIGVCVFRAQLRLRTFLLKVMLMELYRVSFIGHSKINNTRHIEKRLQEILKNLIQTKEFVEFYIGRNGDFDILVASEIKRVQKSLGHQNSSLILVLPYKMKDGEYYEKYYDEIYYPIDSATHFKSAITKRNQWMIDNSDLLIAFVETDFGGAYTTLKYAQKKGKRIVNVAMMSDDK